MIRETYVYRDGELIPKPLAGPLHPRGERSHLGFNFISDKIWDLQGQHDGQVYDSKSALRRSYRERGLIELGNDAPRELLSPNKPWRGAGDDVVEAYQKVRDGYKPRIEAVGDLPGSDQPFAPSEAGADERLPTD